MNRSHFFIDSGSMFAIDLLDIELKSLFISIFFFVGCFLSIRIRFKNNLVYYYKYNTLLIISILSCFFMYYTLTTSPNDIDTYYLGGILFPILHDSSFSLNILGQLTISYINRFLYYFFNLDFFSISVLFTVIHVILAIFYDQKFFKELNSIKNSYSKFLLSIIIFFPSFTIWKVFLGKEIMTFFCLVFLIYLIYQKNFIRNLYLIVALCLLLFLIRPHLGVITTGCIIIYYQLNNIENKKYFFLILLINFLVGFPLLGYFLTGELFINYNSIIDIFFDKSLLQRSYIQGPSWINTSYSSTLELFLNFLFKPLFNFYTPRNIILSLENIFLLISIVLLFISSDFKKFFIPENFFCLILFLSSAFILSHFISDIGIYWRQKWIVLPILFIFLVKVQKIKL
jgi:hypothetical protein